MLEQTMKKNTSLQNDLCTFTFFTFLTEERDKILTKCFFKIFNMIIIKK